MCTVVVIHGVRQDYPLVIATNRDEFYARPATGPLQLGTNPPAVGGRDMVAGGTWFGVTQRGYFVALTNQRRFGNARPDALSRGQLVLGLLGATSVSAAHAWLQALDARRYLAFNVLFGDCQQVWLAYGREDQPRVHTEPLPTGVHVLPNDVLDSPQFPKCERAKELVEPHVRQPWPQLEAALRATLADRQRVSLEPPAGAPAAYSREFTRELSALCVRTADYGTRSSTLVALQPGRCAHYLYADGPPDRTEFKDITPLFSDGSQRSGAADP